MGKLQELREKLASTFEAMEQEEDADKFKALQEQFADYKSQIERLEFLEAEEKAMAVDKFAVQKIEKPMDGYEKACKDLAGAARNGFVVNKSFNEGTPTEGGYTVPEDIRTKIEHLRDVKANLRSLVSVETVKTLTGQRTYQNRATGAGFASVEEGGKIPQTDYPSFFRIKYNIVKYAGFMMATNELLADSDANIASTVIDWFAENSRVTDNKIILATLNEKYTRTDNPKTPETIAGMDDIKKIINVMLGQAFAPTSVIVTNDDGLQFLDTLKDKEDHTYLKVDENNPLNQYLAVGFRRVPIQVIPNGDLPSDEEKGVPFYIGDLKEACRIYDRQMLSLMASNVAAIGDFNAYEQDLTVWRGIERLDSQLIDESAYHLGYYKQTTKAAG